MPASVNIALFRVTQEALINVVKHAQANSVIVQLRYRGERISVCIEDDGRGFDVHKVNRLSRQSWGLLGMRERTSLLDGQFSLESDPGKGVKILVSIPYQQDETAQSLEVPDDDKVIIS